MPPRISVVMAAYNGAEFIREQLDSIREQTLPPDEVIIADDCS
ncbi:MAG: glycosyltransferase, partial [Synergistaceae bacterium]|nr:glycosyltransferase [Synergistaceae bacterium]